MGTNTVAEFHHTRQCPPPIGLHWTTQNFVNQNVVQMCLQSELHKVNGDTLCAIIQSNTCCTTVHCTDLVPTCEAMVGQSSRALVSLCLFHFRFGQQRLLNFTIITIIIKQTTLIRLILVNKDFSFFLSDALASLDLSLDHSFKLEAIEA